MNNPHKNARTTPLGRAEMIRRIVEDGRPVAEVAAGFGISERRARTWLARWRAEGPAGLENRSSRAGMETVIEATLVDLGLAGHQALIVAHGDTANPHLHIALNRVHPITGVAWSTKHDYARLERSVYRQAQRMGFAAVPGRHNDPGNKRSLTRARTRGAMMRARKAKNEAERPWNRKQTEGVAPLLRRIFESGQSWSELREALRAAGGELEAKGQGLIVRDQGGTGYVKLSSLGPGIRLGILEQKFGERFADFLARPLPTINGKALTDTGFEPVKHVRPGDIHTPPGNNAKAAAELEPDVHEGQ